MTKTKTYRYLHGEVAEGPYLESQIISLADAGVIRADAIVECIESGEKGSLSEFLESLPDGMSISRKVLVRDVSMPFRSMVWFVIKWALASIPAAIVLYIVYMVIGALS